MPRCLRLSSTPKRLGRAWLAALLVALLCSQSLGLLHRLVHAAAIERSGRPDAVGTGRPATALDRFFAGHAATHSLCLVFDQISHSSPLPATPVLVGSAPALTAAPAMAPTGRRFGATTLPFQARGPPLRG